ncbi:hypothetical protein IAR55_005653 [Kwoniella newhampshirensis]|uniref:Uncharacterized protein n=1 Tax=Kwoniella newhampshirensis TaxID=1651941 RepID=A0AAW0YKK6_9TREE
MGKAKPASSSADTLQSPFDNLSIASWEPPPEYQQTEEGSQGYLAGGNLDSGQPSTASLMAFATEPSTGSVTRPEDDSDQRSTHRGVLFQRKVDSRASFRSHVDQAMVIPTHKEFSFINAVLVNGNIHRRVKAGWSIAEVIKDVQDRQSGISVHQVSSEAFDAAMDIRSARAGQDDTLVLGTQTPSSEWAKPFAAQTVTSMGYCTGKQGSYSPRQPCPPRQGEALLEECWATFEGQPYDKEHVEELLRQRIHAWTDEREQCIGYPPSTPKWSVVSIDSRLFPELASMLEGVRSVSTLVSRRSDHPTPEGAQE